MRTIRELIGEEREKLPGTIGKTSLFVKEIIERYGQGGNYMFDPASFVYLLPAAPEEEEKPEKRPEEEKAREYVIRERQTQKLEIREKGSREFVQRILESVRLPGAKELLRQQSVKQQLTVWLRELVREYQEIEQDRISELEKEVRAVEKLRETLAEARTEKEFYEKLSERRTEKEVHEKPSEHRTEKEIHEIMTETDRILLSVLENRQIREEFYEFLARIQKKAAGTKALEKQELRLKENWTELYQKTDPKRLMEYRREQIRELTKAAEETLRTVYLQTEQPEAAEEKTVSVSGREETISGENVSEADRVKVLPEADRRTARAAEEMLQPLEQAWILLRQESVHLDTLENFHSGIQKLQEHLEKWQQTVDIRREKSIREEIRENLRQIQIQRNILQERAVPVATEVLEEENAGSESRERTPGEEERVLKEAHELQAVRKLTLKEAEQIFREEHIRREERLTQEERSRLEETVQRTKRFLEEEGRRRTESVRLEYLNPTGMRAEEEAEALFSRSETKLSGEEKLLSTADTGLGEQKLTPSLDSQRFIEEGVYPSGERLEHRNMPGAQEEGAPGTLSSRSEMKRSGQEKLLSTTDTGLGEQKLTPFLESRRITEERIRLEEALLRAERVLDEENRSSTGVFSGEAAAGRAEQLTREEREPSRERVYPSGERLEHRNMPGAQEEGAHGTLSSRTETKASGQMKPNETAVSGLGEQEPGEVLESRRLTEERIRLEEALLRAERVLDEENRSSTGVFSGEAAAGRAEQLTREEREPSRERVYPSGERLEYRNPPGGHAEGETEVLSSWTGTTPSGQEERGGSAGTGEEKQMADRTSDDRIVVEERIRRELEERVQRILGFAQEGAGDRKTDSKAGREENPEETENRIPSLIMGEVKLLPLAGRMSEKAWEGLQKERTAGEKRKILLQYMTPEEFWKAESRVLEKYTLNELERSSLERLEREMIHRNFSEQTRMENVWQPAAEQLRQTPETLAQEISSRKPEEAAEIHRIGQLQDRLSREIRVIRRFAVLEERLKQIDRERVRRQAADTAVQAETKAGIYSVPETGGQTAVLRTSALEKRLLSETVIEEQHLIQRTEEAKEETAGNYEAQPGLEYHSAASVPENGKDGGQQERFRYHTAAAERERLDQQRNEQQQRQLRSLQETARRQTEQLARMEEQQKQLREELSKAQTLPEKQEAQVLRRIQEELSLERLRRGLD